MALSASIARVLLAAGGPLKEAATAVDGDDGGLGALSAAGLRDGVSVALLALGTAVGCVARDLVGVGAETLAGGGALALDPIALAVNGAVNVARVAFLFAVPEGADVSVVEDGVGVLLAEVAVLSLAGHSVDALLLAVDGGVHAVALRGVAPGPLAPRALARGAGLGVALELLPVGAVALVVVGGLVGPVLNAATALLATAGEAAPFAVAHGVRACDISANLILFVAISSLAGSSAVGAGHADVENSCLVAATTGRAAI